MRDTVLIVGAGPTGLVLALWLTRQGVKVRIIDKTAGPGTTSRAMAVQARTLELYRQLDLADAVIAAGHQLPAISLWVAGKKRAALAFHDVGRHLTPYSFVLVYPQDRHERLLVDRLAALGVHVERQTECLGFDDMGDCVRVRVRGADGGEQVDEVAYIAGCDGARSIVRHRIGAGFVGATYDKLFYVADVAASGPAATGEGNIALDEADFVVWLPYDDAGNGRLIGVVDDADGKRAETLGFDDVGQRAIARVGLHVDKVNWFSTYRVHHRVTERYRRGRAFLVGDAAHVHSPAGGQGMNTGIGDAINLAWKLAAVLKQQAPDSLLDSYEAERRAFALKLVETTDRVFSFVTADGRLADFMRAHIVPLFAPLGNHIDAAREYLFRVLSQTMISYRDGPISAGVAGGVHGGDRLPWVAGPDGGNVAGLDDVAWQVHVYGEPADAVAGWCAAHGVAMHRVAWRDEHAHAGFARDAAYLLRPDSYVACAAPNGDIALFTRYLAAHGLLLSGTMAEV
jgi:2-polyprenyl-6-methoxyphenol hydroxylase-like FAD-dependent oxidoreductase